MLEAAGRVEEAGPLFAKSIAGLDRLASENPKAVDTQNYLGYIYEQQANLLAKLGQPGESRTVNRSRRGAPAAGREADRR